MSEFVHLHVHTEYSLLDGACKLPILVSRAKELGQTALAITDHGVMYGAVDFYKECKKQGIKPIIGCEMYVAPRTRFDKQHRVDSSPYHLVLLCENNEGYQNLIKLVSAGFIDGFYSKPRVDRELLERYHKGLIALSGCLAGEIPRALAAEDFQKAADTALWYEGVFGKGNFFIEIQHHKLDEQLRILPLLERLSRETGIPMVATNDLHYVFQDDAKMQNVLICIQTNRTVQQGSDMEFATEEFYLKSEDEMRARLGDFSGAIENTARIAERCEMEFSFGQTKLPYFEAPGGVDNTAFFRDLCFGGLRRRYGENPAPGVVERLEFELGVIEKMGYTDYFLIVYDFIAHAKSKGIPVGPGRGSGAGSLAAYCSGITGVDPIRYDLLFERFLNPERVSMPDFDIDFCYERRQEVIDYVVGKYGSEHVAQIITFGTMAARSSIRDVGRALGISYQAVDVIAKSIPFEIGMNIRRALEISPEFRALYDASDENRELIDMAQKIEGMARHASTHAAGVVITRDPADTYVPLQKSDESIITQYPMTTLEELGLLKMDFLGLRNLTVISDAQRMIRQREADFDIDKIPLDDAAVFEMLGKGHTNGVFQFESAGMTSVLTRLGPEHMEDLIAVISLYRPGPMESIPRYIQNRHNPGLVTYKHPLLEQILRVTYGCIVYQEQVMEICRRLAGYSYGRADLVRRAMSKKKHDVMEQERHSFIYGAKNADGTVECPGCVANGVDERVANEIFDEMSSFASYAFNKSHAAAYALLSYQTAYLKRHYPKEYMAALLTSVLDYTDKITDYISEAKSMGIDVLPPDVNESDMGFVVSGDKIRFGLVAVKNLGRSFIRALSEERASGGRYRDLLDFFRRLSSKDLNRRAVESLIKCGALDCFGHERRQMLMGFGALLEDIEKERRNNLSGQLDLFSTSGQDVGSAGYLLPDVEELPIAERLAWEKETTGLYLSGHPLSEYDELTKRLGTASIGRIQASGGMDGAEVTILGILGGKKTKTTRNGEIMAFATVEDKTGSLEMIVFPGIYRECSERLTTGQVTVVRGRVKEEDGDEGNARLICQELLDPAEALELHASGAGSRRGERYVGEPGTDTRFRQTESSVRTQVKAGGKRGLFLKFPAEGSELVESATNLLAVFEGGLPVIFFFSDQGKYVRTPRSFWVSPNDVLTRELRHLLGENNVALIE